MSHGWRWAAGSVDAGYSRNDTATGVNAPYLRPTVGLPRLVVPATRSPIPATLKLPRMAGAFTVNQTSGRDSTGVAVEHCLHQLFFGWRSRFLDDLE